VIHTVGPERNSAALPLIFQILVVQFFVNKYKDIALKCNETVSDEYGMGDLKTATQFESVPSCTAERSTTSVVCDFCIDDVNELHTKIQQYLASSDSNCHTSNTILKLFAGNRTLAYLFRV